MSDNSIREDLFESLQKLDESFMSAAEALEKRECPPKKLIERASYYQEIVQKIKALSISLRYYLAVGDCDEISRHIRLLSELSEMIRTDADEACRAKEERPALLC